MFDMECQHFYGEVGFLVLRLRIQMTELMSQQLVEEQLWTIKVTLNVT